MNTVTNTPAPSPNSNEHLADEISRMAAKIHAATYRFLVLIREFDKREAWLEMGVRSCAHWLNWRCGISVHTAREKVRVAHALAQIPKIAAAFERGQLSYSKVRAVTRVANADNEEMLLNIALSGTASQLERLVRCEIRTTCEEEIEHNTKQAIEGRYFAWRERADGSVFFQGALPAELAARLIAAIESYEPEVFDDGMEGSLYSDQISGDSVNDQVVAAHDESNGCAIENEDGHADVPAGTDKLTLGQKRADALVALVDQSFGGYQVMLHVPAGTSSRAISLSPGGSIPYAAAERICCDASLIPVLEGASGELLDIGRKTRKIPPALRRALELRDKNTCRFPGCTHTKYLHGHHIVHWANGGKTALANLVLLCTHHHGLVHEGGYGCAAVKRSVHKRGNKWVDIVFKKPDGVVLPAAFCLQPATGLLDDDQYTLNINSHTCGAQDFGTPLDVGVVLDGLRFTRDAHKH